MLRSMILPPQLIVACAALMLLAGCSALSPYSSLTKLDLTLTASDRLNPDLHGRPSPIVVRLFELRNPVAFETADFFSLYDRARDTLTPDLVVIEELELRPGEIRTLKLSVEQGRYVGVLAACRNLNETRWRHVLTIDSGERTYFDLTLDQDGISVTRTPLGGEEGTR